MVVTSQQNRLTNDKITFISIAPAPSHINVNPFKNIEKTIFLHRPLCEMTFVLNTLQNIIEEIGMSFFPFMNDIFCTPLCEVKVMLKNSTTVM